MIFFYEDQEIAERAKRYKENPPTPDQIHRDNYQAFLAHNRAIARSLEDEKESIESQITAFINRSEQ